jgi:thiamine kinase-like enzyme
MALTIKEAIARVPFLKDDPNLSITPLTGGITNLNFRIDYGGGKSCVIRITGKDTDKLGIRREVEHEANYQAGLLGIAPEVLFFIEPEGYLVTRFIKGVKIPPEEMVKEYNIQRVVDKLRKFHQNAKPLGGVFNIFRRIELLTNISEENHCHFPADFHWIQQRMKECEAALLVHPYRPTPCHCDLLNLNFLDENGDVKILDWEYAGQGDIFHDLSNFSHHHKFTEEMERFELQTYFGEITPSNFAHFKLMKPMSEIHEAMWGTTQTGISKLDEDFQGYADYWFDRARKDIQDPRWAQWLLDVSN